MSILAGSRAELIAHQYLLKQGLKLVESNFRCKVGEIDLIMYDGAILVFVEVRARTSSEFGDALSSVSYFKQRKLIKTASYYLLKKGLHDKLTVRFDVVALDGSNYKVTWVKQAFDAH